MNDKVNATLHFHHLMYDILYISLTNPVKNQGQIRELSE